MTPEFDALFAESDPITQRVVLDCFDRPAPRLALSRREEAVLVKRAIEYTEARA